MDAILKKGSIYAVVVGLTVAYGSLKVRSEQLVPTKPHSAFRIATYNASLNRSHAGRLTEDLKSNDSTIQAIATVVRVVQPDILLVNEIDYSADSDNAGLLEQNYFAKPTPDLLGGEDWPMPFHYSAPSNTGIPSGMDLDRNGRFDEPTDAFGFGRFPGQYGMAVFSRFEIVTSEVVTLKDFAWSKLPDSLRPLEPGPLEPVPLEPKTRKSYYPDEIWEKLRLASKSFWDVPIRTPNGIWHVLASHPTPPAFDGPEDRNGCRNHDEVKLIQLYIESNPSLYDDRGHKITFASEAPFFVLGDLNCDPNDGDSRNAAINALLNHPQIAKAPAPRSDGARHASERQGKQNAKHKSDPAEDTADFNDESVGNLRVDYVLPSRHFKVVANGTFWPLLEEVRANKVEVLKKLLDASDHHLVWVDVQLMPTNGTEGR